MAHNERIKLQLKTFQFSKGNFKDDSGREVSFANVMAQCGDNVMKFNSDIDLNPYQGQDVVAICEVKAGSKQVAKLVIVGIDE